MNLFLDAEGDFPHVPGVAISHQLMGLHAAVRASSLAFSIAAKRRRVITPGAPRT